MLKIPRLEHDLPTSINGRVISPFSECFVFVKFCENKRLTKISEFTVTVVFQQNYESVLRKPSVYTHTKYGIR